MASPCGFRYLAVCFQPPFCMRRGAQGKADQGSRLSERSEFERDPALTEHRRLPVAKRRDADSRVAFLFVSDPAGRARTPSRRNFVWQALGRWSTVAVRATHDRQSIGAFWARTLAWSGCVFDIGEAHGSRLACLGHPV